MRIEVGELTNEMQIDVKGVMEQVIERFKGKEIPYFILVYSEEGLDVVPVDGYAGKQDKLLAIDDKRVIRTRVLVLSQQPPPMLGTLLYKVDNQKGEVTRIWALPLNIPETGPFLDEENVVHDILESSQIIGKLII